MTSRRLLLTLVLNSCVLSTFVRECVYPFVLGVLSCRKNNKKKTFFKHFCWIIVAGHVITFPFFLSFFFVSLFVQASFCRLLSSLLQPTGFHPFFFSVVHLYLLVAFLCVVKYISVKDMKGQMTSSAHHYVDNNMSAKLFICHLPH